VIIFVTAKIKTELKEEGKPKLIKTEEKAGEIKSKVVFDIFITNLTLSSHIEKMVY
jgi:hypothetical protein